MVRRAVAFAVLLIATSLGLSVLIAAYTHRRIIRDVTDLMEGLQLYVQTNARRE